jgi:hypothetical protein
VRNLPGKYMDRIEATTAGLDLVNIAHQRQPASVTDTSPERGVNAQRCLLTAADLR